ncbi:hypothetical protein NQ315_006800 [Exocentrus adspersus]|uniref:Uncharacterized protein n=1 Tax=Exocentrus adspersus TaxID=1586481 RepID=A0AAV8WBN5_9CUCU|nr:hypothetical protein NQ315_006800 [Exocentrus adspersus]
MSSCDYFPLNSHPYQNLSIPDISAYYSFLNYSNPSEPMSLPVYPINYPNYSYPSLNFMGNFSTPKSVSMANNHMSHLNGDSEYLSLPVVNADQNDDTSKRRFSDPGLPNESDCSSNSFEDGIVQKLMHQVNSLKENNRRLSREVMEMRIELNMLKQQQNVRHYDRDYEPGMLADVIREVRDAARVREDALLAKVKHIMEEKQLSMNQINLVAEKTRSNERIAKIEEQLKCLSLNQRSEDAATPLPACAVEDTSNTARQVLELEREALELRRELQDTRAKKEESDKKLLQLDKKLSSILRRNDISTSDISEDGKTASIESLSMVTSVTTTSSMSQGTSRVTLSGPVTDL